MFKPILVTLSATALAAVLGVSPAAAQKSKDTLRVGFLEATQNADAYTDGKPENQFLGHALFDGLVEFDWRTAKTEPLLAESWKQVDAKTLEFKLRRDVKWHDGETFDADDVVYSLSWLTHPKTRLRFKRNWAWIERAEKVDSHTVRVVSKRPTPFALARLGKTNIYPQHIHEPLERKSIFGTKPVGTSMYRATQVDKNRGVIMVANKGYKHGGKAKPASNIGNVRVRPITDRGSQIAEMLAGNVDVLRALTFDESDNMGKDPRFTFTLGQSIAYIYMYFDTAGRSGLEMFKDKRVREALAMAVNSDVVPTVRSGKRKLPRGNPKSLCWEIQDGCGFSAKLPEFNPEKAKKLLAEAGYPNGFDVKLTAFNSVKDFAEVISGQLRKIGVRAAVNGVTFPTYRKNQRDGKIQINANAWSAGGLPDVSGTMGFFFSPGSRDYIKDPVLHKLSRRVNSEMDDAKRRELTKELLDRVINERYIVPVSALPLPIVHASNVDIATPRIEAYGYFMTDANWK